MFRVILGTVLILSGCVDAKGLPSYLQLCNRKDPKLTQCLLHNVMDIIKPKLKSGIPQLYIPPMDPLVIPEATLNSGNNFRATFTDIQLYHADEFNLKSFDLDLDKHQIDIKIDFPLLRIKSIYNIVGTLLVLNLDGKGAADGNYTNAEVWITLNGKLSKKNDKEFVSWKEDKFDIKIEKINLLFEKLFGDNAELNDQTNTVINKNIDSIFEELKPVVKQVIGGFVINTVNRLFGKFSLSELFPEN